MSVMIVEDDDILRQSIVDTMEIEGVECYAVASADEAIIKLSRYRPSLILSDVSMPGMNGYDFQHWLSENMPSIPLVLMTAYAETDKAIAAIKKGAIDYLIKPFSSHELIRLVNQFMCSGSEEPVMQDQLSLELYDMAGKVAQSDVSVLIRGESGTGKEVLSRYIHRHSARSDSPFIAINCAAIPENMLEATLFGYEKGAFTGATSAHAGKFEQAQGGTLLLDEISEMPLALQAKLLRVLQEREVERLGSRKTISLDVRVLATSNRDIETEVKEKRFREDLFYRLNVMPLNTLPLRQRPSDVLPLVTYFIQKHGAGRDVVLSPDAEKHLLHYDWPGNSRELENVVQRALVLSNGVIDKEDLLISNVAQEPVSPIASGDEIEMLAHCVTHSNLQNDMKEVEFYKIVDAIKAEHGSRKKAANRLGISDRTLRYKLASMRKEGLIIEQALAS